ncbi:MAG: ATP synthase F1 subunit epsilon [Candidatus Moranbacteria bacterium RIFOXYA12_FULL_35_19]|nr:MAG: ATP synthase epsilon chain [Candidatus Moranbacteria bacterium GW2011_GWF2_35_39]OGI30865.1 MAG: ATP synthase F1 subunit epsilon [Candidatus Moranbacteria bacterium RIFOXYB12_FULL_35_8]OGI33095.1 MAG: ATP synthase F1 subunit epsilon [Candidatus Moranbacteria bacterium RIFOXYC12_FULL_36_13]OGI35769.1 MAG: ATP synthase F1 subunit epsilon [Candidatus Moranbacteria bacterium RIFOXYA12_FULL_35_19]
MSKSTIKFKIVTPEKTVFEDTVDQATLPTADGEVTILPNHISYIASLKAGELMLKKKGEEILLCISGGFIEFHNNELIILADTAERAEEIDLKRAEEGRRKAEELKNKRVSMDENEYARVAAAIQKESARIRVAKKHYTKLGMKA